MFPISSAVSIKRLSIFTRSSTTLKRSFRTSSTIEPLIFQIYKDDIAFSPLFTVISFLAISIITGACTICEKRTKTNGKDDGDTLLGVQQLSELPEFTSEDVVKNNGKNGTPIWMTYGGLVYDVSNFVANHPGGSEKILQASGNAIEPFWNVYRQHYSSDLPMKLMEGMVIGTLQEEDQGVIDRKMDELLKSDPYCKEPVRHKALKVHSETPMNAEIPSHLITNSFLTPINLFYIRHHHPVPFLSEKEAQEFKLTVDLTAYGKGVRVFTLQDLKKLPKSEVVATLQCSGNRRGGFNDVKRTSGTPWGQGAISTAKWGGVKLSELIKLAGVLDPIHAEEVVGIEHVRFHGLDGMMASIGIEKALNLYGDCLIAYEMNGETLPRDHGFPLRVVVPGYAAVRNVKWLSKIELATTEAEGPWQRGLNYKTLPPSITDAGTIQVERAPGMTEVSIFSGITMTKILSTGNPKRSLNPGETVIVECSGWAWAGGGRNIVRVDVTGDDGESWVTSELTKGTEQKFGRAWAWTFWTCKVPAIVGLDGHVRLASKAVDLAFNVQPEKCSHTWNVRGLGNNSWYRTAIRAVG